MSPSNNQERIAITGMACRFAGSGDLRAFWLRILNGRPAFSDCPDGEASRFLVPGSPHFNRVATLHGGYLRDLWQTHPGAVGLNAAALAGINPEQVLALDLAGQALRDAGYAEKGLPRERTSIILGYAPYLDAANVNWVQHGIVIDQTLDLIRRCFPHGGTQEFETLRQHLQASLPAFDSRNTMGLFHHMIATRIAQRFDIQGAAFAVNAACASTPVALRAALDELLTGRADVVITGGMAGVLSPQVLMPFNLLGYLSSQNAVRPFGRDADGTLPGEGGGILILKRASDARQDGDRVYALIRSVGVAADGNEKDREAGLVHAIARAIDQAGVTPDSVAMIEAHGSGIPSQDRTEIRALDAVFGAQKRAHASVSIGSVKALIGHCGVAAGAAGVIKAALGLYHRIIPPAQEALHPHPQLKLGDTPFHLNQQSRPWVHNDAGQPRRAGVNVIALGGLSAHVLLEQQRREES